jgi:hypothetical protein
MGVSLRRTTVGAVGVKREMAIFSKPALPDRWISLSFLIQHPPIVQRGTIDFLSEVRSQGQSYMKLYVQCAGADILIFCSSLLQSPPCIGSRRCIYRVFYVTGGTSGASHGPSQTRARSRQMWCWVTFTRDTTVATRPFLSCQRSNKLQQKEKTAMIISYY